MIVRAEMQSEIPESEKYSSKLTSTQKTILDLARYQLGQVIGKAKRWDFFAIELATKRRKELLEMLEQLKDFGDKKRIQDLMDEIDSTVPEQMDIPEEKF